VRISLSLYLKGLFLGLIVVGGIFIFAQSAQALTCSWEECEEVWVPGYTDDECNWVPGYTDDECNWVPFQCDGGKWVYFAWLDEWYWDDCYYFTNEHWESCEVEGYWESCEVDGYYETQCTAYSESCSSDWTSDICSSVACQGYYYHSWYTCYSGGGCKLNVTQYYYNDDSCTSLCDSGYCSGGSCAPACNPIWSCTTWLPSPIIKSCGTSFTQTRTCTDSNNCGTDEGKPDESREAIGTSCPEGWTCVDGECISGPDPPSGEGQYDCSTYCDETCWLGGCPPDTTWCDGSFMVYCSCTCSWPNCWGWGPSYCHTGCGAECEGGATDYCPDKCVEYTKYYNGSCNFDICQCDYSTENCSVACGAPCIADSIQSQDCGNCGTQFRTCQSDCTWDSWGSCILQGACSPDSIQSQGCGNCGTQFRTCQSDCTWDSWGSCILQGACSPDSTQSQDCGNCGTQSRTCQSDCTWPVSWGSCTGEGACSPDSIQSCSDSCSYTYCSGSQCLVGTITDTGSQTCQSDCTWDSCSASASCPSNQCSTGADCNQPPNTPEATGGGGGGNGSGQGVDWNNCSFKNKSIPIFNWTYSDPNSDPQAGYEIWVDVDASFADPKFNHLVNLGATSYVLTLSHDDNSDWLTELSWNNTYYWKVKVKDDQGNWSEWSNAYPFTTPLHAYPWSGFSWLPESPTQGEVVVFDPEEENVNYFWTVTEGEEQYADETGPTSEEPHIKFLSSTNKIKLKVTDAVPYSCESDEQELTAQLPLPEYKEIPPIIWLKQIFAAVIDFFDGF